MAMKSEKNRIAMGSCDIYMIEFTGKTFEDIPNDAALEMEANLIGRTKDGATFTHTTASYTAKSDDGIAQRTEMTEQTVTLSFGLITWNGRTIEKIVPTAIASNITVEGTDKKRRRTVGKSLSSADGKLYVVRAVHKDKVKGDVRYTIIGKNLDGFSAAYKPGVECTITPTITAEPDDNGDLYIIDEDDAVFGTNEPAPTPTAET